MKPEDIGHRETDEIIKQIEKRIRKEFAQAHEEVSSKFTDYMKRFVMKDKIWRGWVEDGTKSLDDYKKWLTGQVMIGKRWDDLKDTLATDYQNAEKIADSITQGYMPEVYALNHNYQTFKIEHDSLLDTSYTLYNREAVERLLRDNPKLYKRPGKEVQRRIAEGTLKRWNKQQIQSVMVQGILQGEGIPKLTKRLEAVTGGLHDAAIRNARTMATGVQNAGRIDAMHRAQKLGIKVKKTWVATLDNRTRHAHRELDGVTVDVDEPFENEFGTIMFPGDPDADGANVYNCRCTLNETIEGYEIDYIDMSIRHDDNLGDQTYEEWKEGHSKPEPIRKQEIIGNAIKGQYIQEYKNGRK